MKIFKRLFGSILTNQNNIHYYKNEKCLDKVTLSYFHQMTSKTRLGIFDVLAKEANNLPKYNNTPLV